MKWLVVTAWLSMVSHAMASAAMAIELPIPPVPPASPPSATAAPIPDVGVAAPSAIANAGPTVALKFYRAQTFEPGMGFVPGSRYRSSEDRKPIQTPGFSVSVPLN